MIFGLFLIEILGNLQIQREYSKQTLFLLLGVTSCYLTLLHKEKSGFEDLERLVGEFYTKESQLMNKVIKILNLINRGGFKDQLRLFNIFNNLMKVIGRELQVCYFDVKYTKERPM